MEMTAKRWQIEVTEHGARYRMLGSVTEWSVLANMPKAVKNKMVLLDFMNFKVKLPCGSFKVDIGNGQYFIVEDEDE